MIAAVQAAAQVDPQVGMWALIKIAAVFAVMVYFVRRGVAIGYVLLLAAVLLGFGLGVGFADASGSGLAWVASGTWNLLVEIVRAATLPDSLRLLCLVLTITVFGAVMKHVEKLRELSDALLALLRDRRWTMASLASVIGLLPMPGGAMVSAPMVGEVAREIDVTREDKTAINHWMRHVWESVDPLYPGLLAASAILAVPVTSIMLAQSPLCLAAIVGGVVFLLRLVPHHQRRVGDEAGPRSLMPVVKATAPVLVVIAAAVVPQAISSAAKAWPQLVESLPGGFLWADKGFVQLTTEMAMLTALFCVTCALLKANGVRRREGWRLLRQGVTLKMTALIVSVCVLKEVLKISGSVEPIAAFLKSTGLPEPVVIGSVLFVVGMLLGYTFGFVAVGYVMLKPMMMLPDGSLNYPLAAFAFALGFLGVLLSPVHLCLVLAREHFDAKWGGVYRKLLGPSIVLFLTAVLLLLWA